ncbi:MAG: hypothetical protein FJW35_18685, partial [Acidobacteria bacterium]|nr:hypothetical protein [Acidobacteriota bacterium]
MIDALVAFVRCPRCGGTRLRGEAQGISCPSCSARYPVEEGILNLMPDEASEVITPFQRLMQTTLVVSIYERAWRRLGYFLASSRSFDREVDTVLRLQQD